MQFQPETTIQVAFLLLAIGIFLAIYNLPKKTFKNLRSRNRLSAQSNRHFLARAQLLGRAKSTRNHSSAASLAKSAVSEADKSLALAPHDPAAHILRALAQDLLGHRSSARRSLDAALSPPAVKMLSDTERGDALVKRAEMQLAVNRRRRLDTAVSDLVEAVGLTRDNVKAFCLLGQCYELKGMMDEALKAFQDAIRIQPDNNLAHENLDRLKT